MDEFPEKNSTPRRARQTVKWSRNARKEKKARGEAYVSSTNKFIPAAQLKPPCEDCRNKCYLKIPEERRLQIFNAYYKLADYTRQRDFIHSNTEIGFKKTCKSNTSKRNVSIAFFLPCNGENVKVCKTMFINTLGINKGVVDHAMRKRTTQNMSRGDGRGKHSKKVTASNLGDKVKKSHIQSFSSIPSHYCRAGTEQRIPEAPNFEFVDTVINDEQNNTVAPLSISRLPTISGLQNESPVEKDIFDLEQKALITSKVATERLTFSNAAINMKHDLSSDTGAEEPFLSDHKEYISETVLNMNFAGNKKLDMDDFLVENTKIRKRKCQAYKWPRNVRKDKRVKGEAYLSCRNKLVPAVQLKSPCEGCRNKCYLKIAKEERLQIFNAYYKLADYTRQRDFIHNHTEIGFKKTCKSDTSKRNVSITFFLPCNGENVKVCKTMFVNTLGIKKGVVDHAMKKRTAQNMSGEDKRETPNFEFVDTEMEYEQNNTVASFSISLLPIKLEETIPEVKNKHNERRADILAESDIFDLEQKVLISSQEDTERLTSFNSVKNEPEELSSEMAAKEQFLSDSTECIPEEYVYPEVVLNVTFEGNSVQEFIAKAKSRKRTRQTHKWARNVRKEKRAKGEAYLSYRNKLVPAAQMKSPCEGCRNKCYLKITKDERLQIFNAYYKLADYTRQRNFIHSNTVIGTKKTCKSNTSKRNVSITFFLPCNGGNVKVCKTMFVNTLGINKGVVDHAMRKRTAQNILKGDQRGRHSKKVSTSNLVEKTKNIQSFSTVSRAAQNGGRTRLRPRVPKSGDRKIVIKSDIYEYDF